MVSNPSSLPNLRDDKTVSYYVPTAVKPKTDLPGTALKSAVID